MKSFAIKSVSDGVELVLGPVRDEAGYYYDAEIRSPVVSGRVNVYDHHASRLAAFFGDLATLWRSGWEGEKTYESLEGQLRIVVTRDSVGHVYVEVALWDGMGGPDFKVGARLVVEAGQLESVAAGVKDALVKRGGG